MNGLADVDGFKIGIKSACGWAPPVNMVPSICTRLLCTTCEGITRLFLVTKVKQISRLKMGGRQWDWAFLGATYDSTFLVTKVNI